MALQMGCCNALAIGHLLANVMCCQTGVCPSISKTTFSNMSPATATSQLDESACPGAGPMLYHLRPSGILIRAHSAANCTGTHLDRVIEDCQEAARHVCVSKGIRQIEMKTPTEDASRIFDTQVRGERDRWGWGAH